MKNNPEPTEIELSPRWSEFVSLYIKSGNALQSAVKAGFSSEYARVITTRFPDKVRKSLTDALEGRGITSEKIAEKIEVLLDATKQVYAKDSEGNQEIVAETPDYQAIDKGIAHATRIYGIVDEPPKTENNTYNFIFNPEIQKDIKQLEESIKNKLLGHVEQNN